VSSSAAVFVGDLGTRHRKNDRSVRRWNVSSYDMATHGSLHKVKARNTESSLAGINPEVREFDGNMLIQFVPSFAVPPGKIHFLKSLVKVCLQLSRKG
jgi:hypothetical protein